jgi:hypothetical protein
MLIKDDDFHLGCIVLYCIVLYCNIYIAHYP